MLVVIKGDSTRTEHELNEPINLLHLLQEHDAVISAPCGGNGSCGKCRVFIEGHGSVLACKTVISPEWASEQGYGTDDSIIVQLPKHGKAQISSDGLVSDVVFAPLLNRGSVKIDQATIIDQRSNEQRFEEASGMKVPFSLLAQLSEIINSNITNIDFVFRRDSGEVTHFMQNNSELLLGIAIDIGTTTLAAWLYDLDSGEKIDVNSRLNPQSSYGADVISRIEYIENDNGNLVKMQKQIARALAEMTAEMLVSSGLGGSEVQFLSISGNTTMMHILSGLNPSAIARSPFVPVSISEKLLKSSLLGLDIVGDPLCLLLPSISAYAGADITAGIMACGLFRLEKEKKLLVDLGTNGEIVLSLPGGITACSTAAGPAFEAANISCGMSGTTGAIDKVWFEGEQLKYSVIGGLTAKGICGSGLISAVAVLLKAGIIDETGRLTDATANMTSDLSARCSERDGNRIFWLDRPNGEIYLSQHDIRELQNAKAAVAAGVARLLKHTKISADELDEVLLAGGFGYYLNVDDAYTIGLLPSAASNRTRSVGNTSGMGAIACMLNDELRQEAALAALSVDYFELSTDPVFSELYIEAMMFPEQE